MGYNCESHIVSLEPHGTNSTMFTSCCGTAICDSEGSCPSCNNLVIGHDAETSHETGRIRWANATAHWKRKNKH